MTGTQPAVRPSGQQEAVLQALIDRGPQRANDLRDVHRAGDVLRRLRDRGLVSSERDRPYGEPGRAITHWSITDAGLEAMGWS